MNREMIRRVADAIEAASQPQAAPEVGFNMSSFVNSGLNEVDVPDEEYADKTGHACGTTACIAGWAMMLNGVPLNHIEQMPYETAVIEGGRALGIKDIDLADELFSTSDPRVRLEDITPDQAVAVLRHLAITGEVNWWLAARDQTP